MPYLHHVLIHFPVALGLLAALCALATRLWSVPFWGQAWRLLSYGTALVAILAAGTGLLSARHLIEGGVSAETIALHRNAALGATALFVVTALGAWMGDRNQSASLSNASRVGSIAAAMAVAAAAHFGGDMLHPGMAPWSTKPHSHGTAAPHGHGGDEPADDHGHDDEHGAPMEAGAHIGMAMAMPAVDAAASDAGNMLVPSAAVASTGDAGRAPPAPSPAHVHQHGPGGRDAPASSSAVTPTAAPTPVTPTPPAMTGMPPDHKM